MTFRLPSVQSCFPEVFTKPVATVLTQVVIDPYDDAFAEPEKIIGRVLTKEEAEAEEHKGNFVNRACRSVPTKESLLHQSRRKS